MARKRTSMREGPLAELFRATEAAQKGEQAEAKGKQEPLPVEPQEETVEHVPTWEESVENVTVAAAAPAPVKAPEPAPVPEPEPELPPAAQYSLPEAAPRIHRAPPIITSRTESIGAIPRRRA